MKADHNKLQSRCFLHFWNNYPNHRRMMWMNLNNAPDARTGAMYKSLGMVAGVADMSLVSDSGVFVGIEFKVGKDKQSQSQIEFQERLQERGAYYYIVSDFDQFLLILAKHCKQQSGNE
jgi:hypothetical protein